MGGKISITSPRNELPKKKETNCKRTVFPKPFLYLI
jgi:hypothetical protein